MTGLGVGDEDGDEDSTACQGDKVSLDGHLPNGGTARVPGVDSGWAWVICTASFFVIFVVDGVIYAFGVILLTILEHFDDSSRSKASWVGSALMGACMSMGPVVGFLVQYFSCRQVMILGSAVASFGFLLSIFAPNVETLILTYGCLGGAGFGLVFVPAVLAVGIRFTEKRAIATGIAMSGSGAGTFALSFLTERLIHAFGWKGALLILTGIVLQLFICSAAMRPLVDRNRPLNPCCIKNVQKQQDSGEPLKETEFEETGLLYEKKHPRLAALTQSPDERQRVRLFHSNELLTPSSAVDRRYKSDVYLHDVPPLNTHTSFGAENSLAVSYSSCEPIRRKDIFYSGSLCNLPEYQRDPNMASFIRSMADLTSSTGECSVSISEDSRHHKTTFLSSIHKLLQDKVFLMLLVVMVSWTGQLTVLTYLPDMAVSRGVSTTEAALLLSMVGGTNLAGRLASGWLANLPNIDSVLIYTCALFIGGLMSGLFPFCVTFWMFIVCSCCFGLSMGALATLRTIVLADVLGISRLTNSFGLVVFVQGILFTVGPPFSGALYDSTKTFLAPYLVVAAVFGVGGLTCALVRPVQKRSSKLSAGKGRRQKLGDVDSVPKV